MVNEKSDDSKIRRVLGHRDCKNQHKNKAVNGIHNNVTFLAKKSHVREKTTRKPVSKNPPRKSVNLANFIPTLPKINVTAAEIAAYTEFQLIEDMNETINELNNSGFDVDVDEYKNSIDKNIKRYSNRCLDFISRKRMEDHDPFDILLDEFKGDMDEFEEYKSQFVMKPKKICHITWCGKCGKTDGSLLNCKYCCIAYHRKCNYSKRASSPVKSIKLRPSVAKIKRDLCNYCPQCKSGETLCNGDIVWHKLKGFAWWPARILALKDKPKCLMYPPTPHHFPVLYYGSKNYAWADIRQMFSFSIKYSELVENNTNELLKDAVKEAEEDFVSSLGQ